MMLSLNKSRPGGTETSFRDPSLQTHLDNAELASGKGNFNRAIEILLPFQKSPDPRIHGLLGQAYHETKQFASAAHCFGIALKREKSPDWQLLHASSLGHSGKPQEAHDRYQSMLEQSLPKKYHDDARQGLEDIFPALMNHGESLERQGQAKEANRFYQSLQNKILPQKLNSTILLRTARTFQQLKEPEQAEKIYLEMLAADPKQLSPYLELLKLIPEKAPAGDIPWLRQGISYFERHPLFQFTLGEMYLRRKMYQQAEEALLTSAKIKPETPLPLFRLFELYRQTTRKEESLKFLKEALATPEPLPAKLRDPRLFFSNALLAAKNQDVSGAFLFLRNSLLYETALLGENDGGTLKWLEEQYSSQEPSDEQGFFRGFLLFVNGEIRQAKAHMEKIQSRLTSQSLKRDAKRLLDLCQQRIAAENAYASLVAAEKQASAAARNAAPPPVATITKPLAGATASGKLEINPNIQQINQLLDFAQANSDDADIQYETGRKLEKLGDPVKAKACFLTGAKANPPHVPCHHELARWHFRAGEFSEAQTVIAKVLQVDPNHVSSLALSGRISYAKKDFLDALKASLRAIELDADCAEARLVTARVYHESKRYQDALAEIDKGLLALRDSASPISQELEAIRTAIREGGN
jgi:tetratricopeptide (TPR) repeat protein